MFPDLRVMAIMQEYRDGKQTFVQMVERLQESDWRSAGPVVVVTDDYGSRDYGRPSFFRLARQVLPDEDVELLAEALGERRRPGH